MATRKTAAKKAAKKTTNQQAAAKRTAKKSVKADTTPTADQTDASRTAAARVTVGDSTLTDVSKFGTSDTETQKAAAGQAQLEATSFTGDAAGAVNLRVSNVQAAVAEQRAVAEQAAKEEQAQAVVASDNAAAVMNDLQAPLRAPTTNSTQKVHGVNEVGIHPDVTSPTNLMGAQEPALPGTGVADPRDLAPGQDMSPSPPVSSSNILPQPDKPGSRFSKL